MTGGLSAGDLAAMRATVASVSLAGTAVISRPATGSDGMGGQTATYAPAGTAACHVSPAAGDERLLAGRVSEQSDWIITLPAGTDVAATDRIVVGGLTYEADHVRSPRTWPLAVRVEAHISN